MKQQFTKKLLCVCVAMVGVMTTSTLANTSSDKQTTTTTRMTKDTNTKIVGTAQWQNQKRIDIKALSERSVAQGEASIFFVREVDADEPETSVNIAVNGRYQISLQAGRFSQVNSCSGINELSTNITDNKSNDLSSNAKRFDLQSRGTYFFFVEVDDSRVSSISPMSHDYAVQYILDNEMQYQTHQVSRVDKSNCIKRITPPPLVESELPPKEPVAVTPVTMELEILFETDKAVVRPEYQEQITKVAQFMRENQNVTAVVEGHTDSRASDEYNQQLAQRRVEAVRQILIDKHGIDGRRLSAIGYGESRPKATNDTQEGRRQNRRVLVSFSGQ